MINNNISINNEKISYAQQQLSAIDTNHNCPRYMSPKDAVTIGALALNKAGNFRQKTRELEYYLDNNQKLLDSHPLWEKSLAQVAEDGKEFLEQINNAEAGANLTTFADTFLDSLASILNSKDLNGNLLFGGADPNYANAVGDLKDEQLFQEQDLSYNYLYVTQNNKPIKLGLERTLPTRLWAGDQLFHTLIEAAHWLKTSTGDAATNQATAKQLLGQGLQQLTTAQAQINKEEEIIKKHDDRINATLTEITSELDKILTIPAAIISLELEQLRQTQAMLVQYMISMEQQKYRTILQHPLN